MIFLFSFFGFVGAGGGAGPPSTPCICPSISFKKFSLTPPPVIAGLRYGNILFIFHPFGIAGSGYGFEGSGAGTPRILKFEAISGVVGLTMRWADMSVKRWVSREISN